MLVPNLAAVESALRPDKPFAVASQVTESQTPVTLSQVRFLPYLAADTFNSHLPFFQSFPGNINRQTDNSSLDTPERPPGCFSIQYIDVSVQLYLESLADIYCSQLV